MCETGVLFDGFADFVAAETWHHDVGENHIRAQLTRHHNGVIPVISGYDFDILIGERKANEFLNDDRIIGQQEHFGH